jgi:hypothetical protein
MYIQERVYVPIRYITRDTIVHVSYAFYHLSNLILALGGIVFQASREYHILIHCNQLENFSKLQQCVKVRY